MGVVTRNNETRYRPVRAVPYEELTEAERDYELEDKLIFLVAQLEQLMIKLREQETRLLTAVPQLLAEMVNRTVALAETLPLTDVHPTGFSRADFPRAIVEASHSHPLLRLLPVEGHRFRIEMIIGNGQGQLGYLSTSPSSMHQLCQGLMLVLRSYFSDFEKRFYLSVMQERWRGLYQVFISDLAAAVTEIHSSSAARQGDGARG
jgi:hypothetical protein